MNFTFTKVMATAAGCSIIFYGMATSLVAQGLIPPQNLMATNHQDGVVPLTWEAPVSLHLIGYKLYRDNSPDVPVDENHLLAQIDGTSYDDEDITNGMKYYYVVTAIYSEGKSGPSNEAYATPADPGLLGVYPPHLDFFCELGHDDTLTMTLMNWGGLDVDFTITPNFEFGLAAKNIPAEQGPHVFKPPIAGAKTRTMLDKNNQPIILDSGGPDIFGYKWIDSDEPNGPVFDWIDITGVGTYVSMTDDDNQGPFEIGFDFPFYGSVFNEIRICSNGWLSFSSISTLSTNRGIPDPAEPNDLIAPWWDDLDPSIGGGVYYYNDEGDNRFIVTYDWVPYRLFPNGTGSNTFQVILYSNGFIQYQYYVMDPGIHGLDSATVGIENASGAVGLQVIYNQYYVHDWMAIMIKTGWLNTDPKIGVVPGGGGVVDVEVICDASDLDLGLYYGGLVIRASDENHDLDSIEVPVVLDVWALGVEDHHSKLPQSFLLYQNYPNPFNAKTGISYAIPKASNVELSVFNMLGQKVATLASGHKEAGFYQVNWDASTVASGVYFSKLTAGDFSEIHQMTLLK